MLRLTQFLGKRNVACWHSTDIPEWSPHVRCWSNSGKYVLFPSISPFDPKWIFGGLLDHLVGDRKHPWRHIDTECARRLQVDDELKFDRL
jgi:hypothetical protein